MKTTHVTPDDEAALGEVANAVTDASKITGAGISMNTGIKVRAHLSLFPFNAH